MLKRFLITSAICASLASSIYAKENSYPVPVCENGKCVYANSSGAIAFNKVFNDAHDFAQMD